MSTDPTPSADVATSDRRKKDRRQRTIPVAVERRSGKDRRSTAPEAAAAREPADRPEKGERRRQVDPTTCEKEYSDEETAFMLAMDQYKRDNRRPFPTWSEVLEVLHSLGYRKVAEPSAMPGLTPSAEPPLPKKG